MNSRQEKIVEAIKITKPIIDALRANGFDAFQEYKYHSGGFTGNIVVSLPPEQAKDFLLRKKV